MALMAFLSLILGRPAFFFFLFSGGSNGTILSHNTSGISYNESTPVISDITTNLEIVQYGLAFSSKHSMPKTLSTTFRIGSKPYLPYVLHIGMYSNLDG